MGWCASARSASPSTTESAPADPPPPDETPDPADQEPTDESTAETAVEEPTQDTKSADAVQAAVVADFGYTKFRVGVQLGTDHFDYRITTPNGTATATVTIKVAPPRL